MKRKTESSAKLQVCGKRMKKVCLDTDFLVALLRKRDDAERRAREFESMDAEVATTVINAFELYLGALRSPRSEQNLDATDDLLNSIGLLNLEKGGTRKAADILAKLFTIARPIGLRDVLIAGIALSNDYTLVTRNIKHFEQVSGLSLEKW